MFKPDKSIADFFALGFTIFLVLAGAASLAYGYLDFEPFCTPEKFDPFLQKAGELVFTGGVFAAFLKTIQIMNVIRQDLSSILYSDKFISEYLDVHKLWTSIYSAVHKNLYPRLPAEVSRKIIARSIPRNLDYYIKDAKFDITVQWFDRNQSIASFTIDQEQRVFLTKDEPAIITRSICHDFGELNEETQIYEVAIDSDAVPVEVSTSDEPDNKKCMHFAYSIEKDGIVTTRREFRQNLRSDPFYNVIITTFTEGIDVKVSILENDLKVSLVPYGPGNWRQSRNVFQQASSIRVTCGEVFSPREGFALLFYLEKADIEE